MTRAKPLIRSPETVRFAALVTLLVACGLWGGGSRIDIPGLIFLQPLAVLIGAVILVMPGQVRWQAVAVPLSLLAALAMFMVIQLIPLPPEWWAQLPGHARFDQTDQLAGLTHTWRPISLTPDLTLASLAGLVVPAGALIGLAAISEEQGYKLLPWLLGIVGVSAFTGVAQVLSGDNSPLYFYSVTNNGSAVGLFSNRNHQAVLLAMGFPLLALWIRQPVRQVGHETMRLWVAGSAAVFLLPAIVLTGSRAGLLLGAAGVAFAWLHLRRSGRSGRERKSGLLRWAKYAPFVAGLVLAVIAFNAPRTESASRLVSTALTDDLRVEATPVLIEMARDFFPVGSGFGSFDPIFRFYEPFSMLRATYLNHAHNDFLETVITGGLPALVLLALFLIWTAPRLLAAFRRLPQSCAPRFAAFSAAAIVLILLSSLVDYPLRTPLMGLLFALACGWLAQGGSHSRQVEATG